MNANLNADFKTIFELDLDPIKVKLMHKESGERWSREQADSVEFEYRRFLCLMKLYPHEQTAPLFDVDIFWHYHILDTMKYAADCQQIFGYFLHHFPYVGLRGDDDEAAHHRVGLRMQELYEATFNEAYVRSKEGDAVTAATAWSVAATPIAMSTSATLKTAWSVAATPIAKGLIDAALKTAWSVAAAPKTDWSLAAVQNDPFYSVRPMLPSAA